MSDLDEAVTADPQSTSPSGEEGASTVETSTSDDSLGAQLAHAITAKPTSDLQREKSNEHFARVELKQLREQVSKLSELMSKPASVAEAESEFDWTNPQASVDRIVNERIKEIDSRYGAKLHTVDQMNAVTQLQRNNALARDLLSDPEVLKELNSLSQDSDAIQAFSNPEQNAIAAALLSVAARKYAAQGTARKSAPAPKREEETIASSPAAQANVGKPRSEVPAAKSIQEAMQIMARGIAAASTR